MNVLVLGVDHEIQKVNAWRSDAMKGAYRNLLSELIAKNGIQFIGEESHPAAETVGEQMTTFLKLPVPWKNIDMPEEARKAAGIFEEQRNRVQVPRNGAVNIHVSDDGFYLDLRNGWHGFLPRVPSDAVREDYMVERAVKYAGDATSIMVLCGGLHVEGLAMRLEARGDKVQTDNIFRHDWYCPEFDGAS